MSRIGKHRRGTRLLRTSYPLDPAAHGDVKDTDHTWWRIARVVDPHTAVLARPRWWRLLPARWENSP